MIQQAKLFGLLPSATEYVGAIADQIATQCEDERQHMLGQRMQGIIARVADGNAVSATESEVDIIDASCRHSNQSQIRQLRQLGLTQRKLVDYGDGRSTKTLNNLGRLSFAVIDPFMIEIRPSKVDLKSVPF
jgi:hypothetical protein